MKLQERLEYMAQMYMDKPKGYTSDMVDKETAQAIEKDIEKIIKEIEKVNPESNGRYNTCLELRLKLKEYCGGKQWVQ